VSVRGIRNPIGDRVEAIDRTPVVDVKPVLVNLAVERWESSRPPMPTIPDGTVAAMGTPLLWHIPLSHFSEKVRWTLDYKRIAHRRRVLGPDYLIRAWRATGRGTLPILFLDSRAIGDSTHIIAALEERYPEPPLYPGDAAARQRALALEDYFDEQLGPAIRAAIVTPLFRHDPDAALRVLTTGMPDKAYQRLRPLVRIFPAFYRFRHKISEAKLEADRATVSAALDRIEQQREGRAYLVGDAFTVADLTAAAMLSPVLQPAEIQYPLQVKLPAYLQDYRATLLSHPAAQWTAGIYRLHRGRSAEVSRRSSTA
jgi:glutathione S-transferase